MLTLEEIRLALADRRIGLVADEVALSRKTIWAVRTGRNTNPSYEVLKKLSDYLTETN